MSSIAISTLGDQLVLLPGVRHRLGLSVVAGPTRLGRVLYPRLLRFGHHTSCCSIMVPSSMLMALTPPLVGDMSHVTSYHEGVTRR